ncbi:exodeoxyribonuclease V alpha subunit [Methylomarinovum caldicuralii]|uniref:RecBCD enzyme subunit RecD n=1 Tax=Methylomarinovum caldicuralii TaxID=438856 RepID=A0AAU9BSD2_9GAMM|nr:exodeoxyribonuclease V subunit alpha [Methylomarinovum caldicuralii]BCX81446.1 exodeoxyribonuclease V alpha subunit [Methylomarinovum caldicuralii]
MSEELHPHAPTLADFFHRRLGLADSDGELVRLLSDLLQAQAAGHVCLTLCRRHHPILRRFPELYRPAGRAPLVLEDGRLYFQRLWGYEQALAAGIRRLLSAAPLPLDRDRLERLSEAAALDDSQAAAVAGAARQRFAIITGGPGTGKTTTVLQLIALRLWQQPALQVALAAPTGKAAQRLAETLRGRSQALPVPEAVKAALPAEVKTLHRLLGARPDTARIRYHADHPLPYDLVVVDEASMVDLALMSKLVQALPPAGALVLLGDRDQLASVEAGSVLADLCDGAPDHTWRLRHAHRFQQRLAELAGAVNAGDFERVSALLGDDWLPLKGDDGLWRAVEDGYRGYWEAVAAGRPAAEIHAAFRRFQILCAHRRGPLGAEHLNDELERRWRRRGWIRGGAYYPGRALMILENAPDLDLFNGDIGICLGDGQVWFEDDRRLSPARLPAHQTVFAMTVHKSQGSEFDCVLLVLPTQPSEVLSRELVYTAFTRAKVAVRCWSPPEVLRHAIARTTRRSGGLRDKLLARGQRL